MGRKGPPPLARRGRVLKLALLSLVSLVSLALSASSRQVRGMLGLSSLHAARSQPLQAAPVKSSARPDSPSHSQNTETQMLTRTCSNTRTARNCMHQSNMTSQLPTTRIHSR
ncbi:hypothetical protein LZ32DRAFT_601892 [Colletotrichum eremochloae]|nr:hypothetical protein LZ32DRAFT_601892 [Colletotrichum eremochloae]